MIIRFVMNLRTTLAMLGMMVGVTAQAGPSTIPLYENFGSLTNTPQVDARAFANYGAFVVSSISAYETLNTLYYTNRAVMIGQPGFRFDHFSDVLGRRPAANFLNGAGASIQVGNNGTFPGIVSVRATNIVNKGTITADYTSLLEISGGDVDISRSIVSVERMPSDGGGQVYDPDYIYQNGPGLSDLYWGLGEQTVRSSELVTAYRGSISARFPFYCVTNSLPGRCQTAGLPPMRDPVSFVYTNAVTPTNWVIQVILVALDDTNITPSIALYPSRLESNFFNAATVQLATYLTNNITQKSDLATLYLVDTLASSTNLVLLSNVSNPTTGEPLRAGTYEFTRQTPIEYILGRPTNASYRTNLDQLIYNTGSPLSVTNVLTNAETGDVSTSIVRSLGYAVNTVTNIYAAIGASVSAQVQLTPNSPHTSPTNSPGRIEINADVLNMERTRLRAQGNLTINARHLVSSAQASIDVSSFNYNLGSTNGFLTLQSLTIPEVQQLSGYVDAWSGVWTNQLLQLVNTAVKVTNTTPDEPGGGGGDGGFAPIIPLADVVEITNEITTNVIDVAIHLMMMDARTLTARSPTYLNTLETRSANVGVEDVIRVSEALKMDATSLTVGPNGKFFLGGSGSGQIRDWNSSEFPNLEYLTNLGIISVPNLGYYYGSDASGSATPYARIVNRGTNVATALHFIVDDMEAGGYIGTARLIQTAQDTYVPVPYPGTIRVEAAKLKLESGIMDSYYDLAILSTDMKMRQYTNRAGAVLMISVSGELADTGAGAGNVLKAGQGIQLLVKPKTGALLGTAVQLSTQLGEKVDSTWAADDLGANSKGFVNNAAIGRLFLNPGSGGTLAFKGTGEKNGMYVDFLEFSATAAADLRSSLQVETNLTIYFASANLPVDLIESTFPARVKWVGTFSGPNSAVPILVTTDANSAPPKQQTFTINRSYLDSKVIDSDGDGIANVFDPEPFSGVNITSVTMTNLPPLSVAITWTAAGDTVYKVDRTTALNPPVWELVTTYTNQASTNVNVTIVDPVPVDGRQRYYRVDYVPGRETGAQ